MPSMRVRGLERRVRALDDLDAAALAAPAGVDLRLDDDGAAAELDGGRARLVAVNATRRRAAPARRSGAQDRLCPDTRESSSESATDPSAWAGRHTPMTVVSSLTAAADFIERGLLVGASA